MIFDCSFWAVVRVDIAHNADDSICEQDTIADVVGVWDQRDMAEHFIAKQNPKKERSTWETGDYCTEAYFCIPCSNLKVQHLFEVERKLEESAKLLVMGIGAR